MKHTLEVYLPYAKSLITQRFGANANYSYARDGLKGHTAYDWGAVYGVAIPNCTSDAYCYSILNKDNPDPAQYRAVFTLVETETGIYEISYGHCSDIYAEVGQTYQVGDVLALVGNTGDVFDGNHEVTRQERLNGSRAGAHLHGPQIRVLRKDAKRQTGVTYIRDNTGYIKKDGMYLAVPNYTNGYNGCVSLAPFSTETLAVHPPDVVPQEVIDIVKQGISLGPSLPEPQRKGWYQSLLDFLNSLIT